MESVIVVGAGVAGLSCASALVAAGKEVQVLEMSDDVGGRVRTDEVEGFLLDRGFQVLLEAYPAVQELLDVDALKLQAFGSGARVYLGGRWTLFPDPLRHPARLFQSLVSPVGSLADKLRLLTLRSACKPGAAEQSPWTFPDASTAQHWRALGFSDHIIQRFLLPFYRGVFLEEEMETSCRMFRFTFGMFATGRACLPAEGMQAVPRQLASRIGNGRIRLHSPVLETTGSRVTLQNGDVLEADAVVLAYPVIDPAREWNAVTTLSFAAAAAPFAGPWLALNGSGAGMVNQVVVPSAVAPTYAPPGQHLVTVSILGSPEGSDEELDREVRSECHDWFGAQVDAWKLLRVQRIPHALPRQQVGSTPATLLLQDAVGRYRCGDVHHHASLQGAMESGLRVAEAVLAGS